MPICLCPHSVNSYALSKIWFKTNCLDLRVTDIKNINSNVKSWLYSDMFEKPEQLVLHRPVSLGGLNLQNVKYKALATFIRSFMETAVDPRYLSNLFHKALFEHHVLGNSVMPAPLVPTYFSPFFFTSIKRVRESTKMNIAVMSVRQWYQALMSLDDQTPPHPLAPDPPLTVSPPCRVERPHPQQD